MTLKLVKTDKPVKAIPEDTPKISSMHVKLIGDPLFVKSIMETLILAKRVKSYKIFEGQ